MNKIISSFFFLALLSYVHAGTYYVDPVSGEDSATSDCSLSTPCKSLNFVVKKNSGTKDILEIILAPGTYTGASNAQIEFSNINRVNLTGILAVDGTRPRLDCQKTNSSISIANALGYVVFNNIEITNCQSNAIGGALNLNRLNKMTINNCIFSNNIAANGGAINSVNTGSIYITNSLFTNNSATSNGGGVNMNTGTLIVLASSFVGNSAGNSGGAVYATELTEANMKNTLFRSNIAGSQAGGIYEQTTGSSTTLFLFSNTTLDNNCLSSSYTDSKSAQFLCLANCSANDAPANFTGCENIERIIPPPVENKKLLSTTNKVIIGVVVPFVILAAVAIGLYVYYHRSTKKEMKKRTEYRSKIVMALSSMSQEDKERADREALIDTPSDSPPCQLCQNRPINTILPCGHKVVCTYCRTIVLQCPVKKCKKPTRQQSV